MNLTVKPQYALFAPNTSKQLFMIHPNANTYASHPPTYPPTQMQPGVPYHSKQMDDVMSQQHQARQQQQQQQQQHAAVAAAAMMASTSLQPQQHPTMHYSGLSAMPPPDPSSITDHGLQSVNINQLAEFASSMVFLMWHARRPSVLALYNSSNSATTSPVGTPPSNTSPTGAGATASGQHRQNIIGNSASPAFKKFCLQVS
jgi:hypothetical protein